LVLQGFQQLQGGVADAGQLLGVLALGALGVAGQHQGGGLELADDLLINVALEGVVKDLDVVLEEFGELGLRQDGLPARLLFVAGDAARGEQANAQAQNCQAEAHSTCPSHQSYLLVWPAAPPARGAGSEVDSPLPCVQGRGEASFRVAGAESSTPRWVQTGA